MLSEESELYIRNNHIRGIEVEAIREVNREKGEYEVTGGELRAVEDNRGVIEPLADRIVGRVLAEDIYDRTGVKIGTLNEAIDAAGARAISEALRARRRIKVGIGDSRGDYDAIKGRLIGGRLGEDVYSQSGVCYGRAGDEITPLLADKLMDQVSSPERVSIRSVLTCKSVQGVCQKRYGRHEPPNSLLFKDA